MTKRSFRIKERALGSFLRATFLQKPARGERCAGVKFAAFRPAAAEPPPTSADGAVLPGSPGPSSSRTLAGPASPLGTSPGARPGLRGRRGRPPAAQPPQMRTRLFRVQNRRRAGTTLAPKIRRNTVVPASGGEPAPRCGPAHRRRAQAQSRRPRPLAAEPGSPARLHAPTARWRTPSCSWWRGASAASRTSPSRGCCSGAGGAAAGARGAGGAGPTPDARPHPPARARQGHLAAPEGPRRLPRVHRPPGAPPATDARRRHRLRRGQVNPGTPRPPGRGRALGCPGAAGSAP